MFTFNNTHIFTGYLKQILSSVAIPTLRVFPMRTDGTYHFDETEHIISSLEDRLRIPYIKNNTIQKYIDGQWIEILQRGEELLSGKFIPGWTKVLQDPGNIYSTTMHEYLGEFLRFLKNAYGLNLMPLYNCFNKRLCKKLNINIDNNIIFNSTDTSYKIYMVPVKLFQYYTIATDCPETIELCCGFYGNGTDYSEINKSLIRQTYQYQNNTFFSQPFLFKNLIEGDWLKDTNNTRSIFKKSKKERNGESTPNKESTTVDTRSQINITRWDVAEKEHDLYLFIKIPAQHSRTITILEGDYTKYNNYQIINNTLAEVQGTNSASKVIVQSFDKINNHMIINFENFKHLEDFTQKIFQPISQLQLLTVNSEESYPFADRLIEYLLGNAITHLDAHPDNIRRVQKIQASKSYQPEATGFWEAQTRLRIYDFFMNNGMQTKSGEIIPGKYLNINSLLLNNTALTDLLGFIDKDVEHFYSRLSNNSVEESLASVDLYENLYNN